MSTALATSVIERAIATSTVIATAESCTGGMIAAALTDIAGSSAVFERGFVTYSNEAKADLLGVPIEHTRDPGAVSALVAEEMAAGALKTSNATLAVSVTGIAGPGGGSAHKPVGLVFMGIAADGRDVTVQEFRFAYTHGAENRDAIRKATVEEALKALLVAMGER